MIPSRVMAGIRYLQILEEEEGLTSAPVELINSQYATTPGDEIDPEYAVNNYIRGNLSRNDLGNGPPMFDYETPGSGQDTRSEHWLNLHYGAALEPLPYTGGGFVGDITPETPQHEIHQRSREWDQIKLQNKVRDFGQNAEQQEQGHHMTGADMRDLYQELHKSRARLMSKNFSSTFQSEIGRTDPGPLRSRSARVTSLLGEGDYHDPKSASSEQHTGISSGDDSGHKSGVLDQELTHTRNSSRSNQIRGKGANRTTAQGQSVGDQHLWSSLEGEFRPGDYQVQKGSSLNNVVGSFKEKSNKLHVRTPEGVYRYTPARTQLDQEITSSNQSWFKGIGRLLQGRNPTPETEQKFGRGRGDFVGRGSAKHTSGRAPTGQQDQELGYQQSSAVGRTVALRKRMHGPTPVATSLQVRFDPNPNIRSNHMMHTGAQAQLSVPEDLGIESIGDGHRSGRMGMVSKHNRDVGQMDHLLEEQKSAVGIAVQHAGIVSRPMAAPVEFDQEIEAF